jgi:ABC-type bacteriocin/lantibiotic exporter with double-glycine peptidase domain
MKNKADNKSKKLHFIESIKIVWDVIGADVHKNLRLLYWLFFITILWSCSILVSPFLIQTIIDKAIPSKDINLLIIYTIGIMASLICAAILFMIQSDIGVKFSERVLLGVRTRIIEKILNDSGNFFYKYSPGDIVTRFQNDMHIISDAFYDQIIRSIIGMSYPLFLAGYLLVWNFKIGIVALATIPIYFLYIRYFQKSLFNKSTAAKQNLSKQTDVFLDIFHGISEIRVFQQIQTSLKRFSKSAKDYTDSSIITLRLSDWVRNGIDFFGLFIVYSPVILGGFMIINGYPDFTIGIIVGCYTYLRPLTIRLLLASQGFSKFAVIYPSFVRIREILTIPYESPKINYGINDTPESSRIEFQDVGFTLDSGQKVLDRFNLTVNPGDKIAIMGPSGCGKSTLLNLLLRFQAPTSGNILFGNKPIHDYNISFYLSFFSYVRQDTHLFRLSVRENVAMGWYHVPENYIIDAIKLVRMNEVVENLPNSYNTILGVNGIHLSGGQVQRLALARAIIRNPEILLLDEFTSSLDEKVEQEILNDLFKIFVKNTIICVTHSKKVAEKFDKIVKIDKI